MGTPSGGWKGVDLTLRFDEAALKRLNEIRASRIDSPFPIRSAENTLKVAVILCVLSEVSWSICEQRPVDLVDPIGERWVIAAYDLLVECYKTHQDEIQRQREAPLLANEQTMIERMREHLEEYGHILQKEARSLGFKWEDLRYYAEKYPDLFRKGTFVNPEGGRPPNGIALQKPDTSPGGGKGKGGDLAA